MPKTQFEIFAEKRGGKMEQPFDMDVYQKNAGFPAHQADGVCAALAMTWVIQNANGDDFFEYVKSKKARAEISMLQNREDGVSEVINSVVQLQKNKKVPHPLEARKDRMKPGNDPEELLHFLEGDKTDHHKYKLDYVEKNTQGVLRKGEDHNYVSAGAAANDVLKHEGYVVFGFIGPDKVGHTLAAYVHPVQGARVFDPSFGECTFDSPQKFLNFLTGWTSTYAKAELGGDVTRCDVQTFPSVAGPATSAVPTGASFAKVLLQGTGAANSQGNGFAPQPVLQSAQGSSSTSSTSSTAAPAAASPAAGSSAGTGAATTTTTP